MGRRGAGEGSIYRRADKRWCAYVTVGMGTRRYIYGRTRIEVAAKLATAVKSKNDGQPLPTQRETVGSFFTVWLEGQRRRLRPRTWDRYEQIVRLHVLPHLGREPLIKLTPQHLDRLYEKLLRGGLGPTSVHHVHAVVHKGLDQALRWRLLAYNVADLVDPPRIAHHEMSVLSPEQTRQLLTAAAGTPLEALLAVAVSSGMRKGELFALRWQDVDLDRGVLSVRGTLQRIGGELVITEPKTAKSRRQVELSSFAIEALRRHRVAQNEHRLQLRAEWGDLDFVFPNVFGRPQEGWHLVYAHFYKLLRDLSLPAMRFHDLRHTAASLMLGRGVHPKIVSEMLGHSTIGITLDLYSHVTPTMQREAARAMDAVLTGAD